MCRFCGATTVLEIAGSFGASPAPPAAPVPPDPHGALALALDFQREHGVDVSWEPMTMERLAKAWAIARKETAKGGKTKVNLPFLTATKNGPLHYERELDASAMAALYAAAAKKTR
jgi:hypothetical protein